MEHTTLLKDVLKIPDAMDKWIPQSGRTELMDVMENMCIFCKFHYAKVDELGAGCEVLNFENSLRIRQKILR